MTWSFSHFQACPLSCVPPLSTVFTFFWFICVRHSPFKMAVVQNVSPPVSQIWWERQEVLTAPDTSFSVQLTLPRKKQQPSFSDFLEGSQPGCFFLPGSSSWNVSVSRVSSSPSFIVSKADTGKCLGLSWKVRRTKTSPLKTEGPTCSAGGLPCLVVGCDIWQYS